MIPKSPITDVFLSYSRRDAASARKIASNLLNRGIAVTSVSTALTPGAQWTDALRESIAQSHAVVFVLGGKPTRWFSFELGAALAWSKPVVVAYTSQAEPFISLIPNADAVTTVAVDKVDLAIRKLIQEAVQLTGEERELLILLYRKRGTSLDQLLLNPGDLLALANTFKRRAKRAVPPELLAKELIRLRKLGRLPAIKRRVSRDKSESQDS